MLMEYIVDHMKGASLAVPKSERYIVTSRVQHQQRKYVGWKMLVYWGIDQRHG